MDCDVRFNLTKDELLGALKTVYLFLDGLNFKNTCAILQEECVLKGCDKFDVVPKNIIIHSHNENSSALHKATQTVVGLDDENESFQLQSSIHSVSEPQEGLLLYYKDPFRTYTMSSKEMLLNIDNKSQRNNLTEQQSIQISKINFVRKCSNEIVKMNGTFYKSQSDPTLNSSNYSDDSIKQSNEKEVIDNSGLKGKLRALERDYKKLMGVTTELTAALQTHIMGQSEKLNTTLNKCKNIYPELFLKSATDNGESPNAVDSKESELRTIVCKNSDCTKKSSSPSHVINKTESVEPEFPPKEYAAAVPIVFENSQTAEQVKSESENIRHNEEDSTNPADTITCHEETKESVDNKNLTLFHCNPTVKVNEEYFELNYQKLKEDLVNHNSDLQLAIVIALRLRITNSSTEHRNIIMSSYAKNDVLSILSSCDKPSVIEKLFKLDCKLQEATSRLVNTITSLKLGREYLCQSEEFLTSFLIPAIKGPHDPQLKINTKTEEMLIAAIQKLSLKNHQRQCMINADLTEYMVRFLSAKYLSLSQYCLEYATALLMNLSLHTNARERLRPLREETIKLLANLLNTDYEFCMPYVNGAIYTLLSDEYMNQEAHRQNFFDLIKRHIKKRNGELRNELEHIIKVHLDNVSKDLCNCDSTVESEFEVNILEPELNDSDNDIDKENILLNYKQTSAEIKRLKCLGRPATPLERTANKHAKISDNKEQPTLSYCEETMQFYYTPTKNAIFDPQAKMPRKTEPLPFSKNVCSHKKGSIYNPNCRCRFSVGKTTPYATNNTLVYDVPISYNVPLCYRDNYEHFKMHYDSKENRYTCNCYQLLSNESLNASNNGQDIRSNSSHRYHFCPKCQKNHRLDESQIELCNEINYDDIPNITNGGVINFSYKEFSDTSGSHQLYPLDKNDPCRDVVFQSRPKIVRTPP